MPNVFILLVELLAFLAALCAVFWYSLKRKQVADGPAAPKAASISTTLFGMLSIITPFLGTAFVCGLRSPVGEEIVIIPALFAFFGFAFATVAWLRRERFCALWIIGFFLNTAMVAIATISILVAVGGNC